MPNWMWIALAGAAAYYLYGRSQPQPIVVPVTPAEQEKMENPLPTIGIIPNSPTGPSNNAVI